MTYPSCPMRKICARIRRCPAALKKLGAQLLDRKVRQVGCLGMSWGGRNLRLYT